MLRAVLFDYGQTLINYAYTYDRELWATFPRASQLAYTYLCTTGQPLPAVAKFMGVSRRRLLWDLLVAKITRRDFDVRQTMARVNRRFGITLTPRQYDEAVSEWYRPIRELATPEPQVAAILRHLKDRGLKLAVVSNTLIPGFLHDQHLAEAGVLDLLDARVYSSGTRVRKPSGGIFMLALKELGDIAPTDTMFVGDTVHTDIVGAKRLGMCAVLKRSSRPIRPRALRAADHVINQLTELPSIVDRMLGPAPAAA